MSGGNTCLKLKVSTRGHQEDQRTEVGHGFSVTVRAKTSPPPLQRINIIQRTFNQPGLSETSIL